MEPRVWVVTGCSQGLGRVLVSAIVVRGDKVVATARDLSSIKDLEIDEQIRTVQLDVTDTEVNLENKAQEILAHFGRCDILVNNAGYLLSGVWEELSHDDILAQFQTNFFGAMKLTKAFLPHLRSQKSGKIFFISSIAGWMGVPAGGAYSASKFALEGAVESLAKEISPFNVQAHLMVLGQFRTNIIATTNKKSSRARHISEYDEMINMTLKRHQETSGRQPGDPKQAAERIIDIARGENMCGRTELPVRIALGSDAVEVIRQECLRSLAELETLEAFSQSTDFPGERAVPHYQ